MAINLFAYGVTEYLSQLLNVFDGFVVIVRYIVTQSTLLHCHTTF